MENQSGNGKNVVLSTHHIVKSYPGVIALNDISVDFYKGEVHAIAGENGAGKSTLIKILVGATNADSGYFVFNGKKYSHITPAQARDNAIEVIYQEFTLVPTMTVAENILLGDYPGGRLTVDFAETRRRAKEVLDSLGVKIDPDVVVAKLSVAEMQLVEIAKALAKKLDVIIMDEPTAPLTTKEVEILYGIIESLKKRGVTVIYISHRLNEIFAMSDRVTVMRDGKLIKTLNTCDTDRNNLIALMVGRELTETYPPRTATPGEVMFEVQNLSGFGVKDINLQVRKGEILGLAGLIGAGRTETAKMIFGALSRDCGKIVLHGRTIDTTSPQNAVKNCIGFLPEDRKNEGVVLNLPIKDNISLPILKRISRRLVLDKKKENEIVEKHRNALKIKTPSLQQLVFNLSGGNQQKVVVSKWLASECEVLIFDEPTRGIDVGSKYEIYQLMNKLSTEGKAIIMITSDMEELLGMSDRIIVLHEGRLAGELKDRSQFSQEKVLTFASGNQ